MKNINKIVLGLILILNFNLTNSQEAVNDTIVPRGAKFRGSNN